MTRRVFRARFRAARERFSEFCTSRPERAFFWGVLIGICLCLFVSIVFPLVLTLGGLGLVLWLLADEEAVEVEENRGVDSPLAEKSSAPPEPSVQSVQTGPKVETSTAEQSEDDIAALPTKGVNSASYKPPRPTSVQEAKPESKTSAAKKARKPRKSTAKSTSSQKTSKSKSDASSKSESGKKKGSASAGRQRKAGTKRSNAASSNSSAKTQGKGKKKGA